jgi:hypothetical protein
MNTLYVPVTDTIIRDYSQRYVHPTTGIIYGGTDYDDAAKLAEIGAVPLTAESAPEGYRALTWETVEVEGEWVHRPATTEVIPAPSLESVKAAKVEQIDARTEQLLDDGVSIAFDFGAGLETNTFSASKVAKVNWLLLLNVARDVINGLAPASMIPRVQTYPDEQLKTLDSPARAFSFCYTVLGAIETLRGSGAVLKNTVSAATTNEAVSAVVDDR